MMIVIAILMTLQGMMAMMMMSCPAGAVLTRVPALMMISPEADSRLDTLAVVQLAEDALCCILSWTLMTTQRMHAATNTMIVPHHHA